MKLATLEAVNNFQKAGEVVKNLIALELNSNPSITESDYELLHALLGEGSFNGDRAQRKLWEMRCVTMAKERALNK